MIRIRFALLALTMWLIFLFNIERPYLLFIGQIDLASMTYVICALIVMAILLLPELGQVAFSYVFLPAMLIYVAGKVLFPYNNEPQVFFYITIAEIVAIFVTVTIARSASVSLHRIEVTVEDSVLQKENSTVLPMSDGVEIIEVELFRARRYNYPVAMIYLHITNLQEMRTTFADRFDLQGALKRRYIQTQIVKKVEVLLYRGDILTWDNDNLVICLPGADPASARRIAAQIYENLKYRLGIDIKLGYANFPNDALIYVDLINISYLKTHKFEEGDTGYEYYPDDDDDKGTPLPSEITALKNMRPAQPIRVREMFAPRNIMPILRRFMIDERWSPELYRSLPTGETTGNAATAWVDSLPYHSGSTRLIYLKLKRLIDLFLVLSSMIVFLPLMLTVGSLIVLEGILNVFSPPKLPIKNYEPKHEKVTFRNFFRLAKANVMPIFFVQPRTGLGGRRFKMYKFRTMVPNAEELLKELAAMGLAKLNSEGKLAEPLKLDRDPRVTRLGRFLRKSSLDELPQILNVLTGDMSIVGPRPTSWKLDSYNLFQTERLSVRPGITGLWQVSSRGTTDFNNWVQWDIKYIDKMSMYLDIQIILRTFMKVVKRSGAR